MVELTVGAFGPCSTWAAIASSVSSLTKLPFQYWRMPFGNSPSKAALMRRIGHRADHLALTSATSWKAWNWRSPSSSGPAQQATIAHEHVAVPVLRDERQRRRDLERGERAHLLGRVLDEVPVEAQDVLGLFDLVEHRAPVDVLAPDGAGIRATCTLRSSRRRREGPRRGRRSRPRWRRRNWPSAVTTSAETGCRATVRIRARDSRCRRPGSARRCRWSR